MTASAPLRLLVDATDCPVKAEVYRLAARYHLPVVLVSARDIGAPFEPWLTKVVAGEGLGAVAEIIAAEAAPKDLIITDNETLALNLLKRDISALTSRGQRWAAEGPQPPLPERARGSSRGRFESVLSDEIDLRLKISR